MAGDDPPIFSTNVSFILIAVGSAALVLTMYHLVAVCLCGHQLTDPNSDHQPPNGDAQASSVIDENSLAQLIPAHKYRKKIEGEDDVDGSREVTCAVCLGDFQEGEEVRTLPECSHSFHVTCIDVWLLSHPNCPVCRAEATPSPVILSTVSEPVAGESNSMVVNDHRRIDIEQNALIQSVMLRR